MCEAPATATNGRSGLVSQPREATATSPRRALRPPPPGHKRSDRGPQQAPATLCAPPPYHPAPPQKIAPTIYCPSNFPLSSLFAYNFSLNYYNTINKITKAHHRAWRQRVCHPAIQRGSVVFFLLSQGLRLGLRKVSPLAGLSKFAPPRPLDSPAWQARRPPRVQRPWQGVEGASMNLRPPWAQQWLPPAASLATAAYRPQAKRACPTASPTPPPICSRGPSAPCYPPPPTLHSAAPVLPPRLPHKLRPPLLAHLTNSSPLFLPMIFRSIITIR